MNLCCWHLFWIWISLSITSHVFVYLVSPQQAAYHLYHHKMFTDTFYMLTMQYKTFSRNALSLSNNDLCQSIFVVHRDFADVNFREIDICEINWYQRQFLPFRYSHPQGNSKRGPMFVFWFQKDARFFKRTKMYFIYK